MHGNTVNSHEPHMTLNQYCRYYCHKNDGGYCLYHKNDNLRNKRPSSAIGSTNRRAMRKMRSLGDVEYWGDTFSK
jgi:hypothetical protein